VAILVHSNDSVQKRRMGRPDTGRKRRVVSHVTDEEGEMIDKAVTLHKAETGETLSDVIRKLLVPWARKRLKKEERSK